MIKKMDHLKYQRDIRRLSDESLRYIIQDAQAAIRANPDNPNNDFYADEANYCYSELYRRQQR